MLICRGCLGNFVVVAGRPISNLAFAQAGRVRSPQASAIRCGIAAGAGDCSAWPASLAFCLPLPFGGFRPVAEDRPMQSMVRFPHRKSESVQSGLDNRAEQNRLRGRTLLRSESRIDPQNGLDL